MLDASWDYEDGQRWQRAIANDGSVGGRGGRVDAPAVPAFTAGSVGYLARKRRWRGWLSVHIVGMSLSYIVLLTAFYVDNGPKLPLWDRLPANHAHDRPRYG
jgi:hypothetical protein